MRKRSVVCWGRSLTMPYLLSEWRGHIQQVWGEYNAARVSVSRLKSQVDADPNAIGGNTGIRQHLVSTLDNLEGTYIIRIVAAFEAALRSYDCFLFADPGRDTSLAVMIDQLGSKKHLRVGEPIRAKVHRVRDLRNFWAHDKEDKPDLMSIDRVRGLLQNYLDHFPDEWG